MNKLDFTYSPLWNLFLITVGSGIFAVAAKAIIYQHNFILGGLFGVALLINYVIDVVSPGVLYFLLNVPLFIFSLVKVSRRFFLYSLYSTVVATVFYELVDFSFTIDNQLYAAVAGGVLSGFGAGIILRSLGSGGGLDIMAILLYQKYSLGIGKFHFMFNCALFSLAFFSLDNDLVIASLIMIFVSTVVIDYVLSMFSQRKLVFIISQQAEDISKEILQSLNQGATKIHCCGAYSGCERDMIMTIINNIQLKRLEEIVFTIDPNALFIVENTFNVLGSTFSRRKVY